MPIVSSVVSDDVRQPDGRRSITERHRDHLGNEFLVTRFALPDENVQTVATARAAKILSNLEQSEIDANIALIKSLGRDAVTVLNYTTSAQNFAVLRDSYRDASRLEAVMMGDFLASLTDTQLRNLFSMTQAQVNTLRTNKLTPAATAAASIKSAVGQ